MNSKKHFFFFFVLISSVILYSMNPDESAVRIKLLTSSNTGWGEEDALPLYNFSNRQKNPRASRALQIALLHRSLELVASSTSYSSSPACPSSLPFSFYSIPIPAENSQEKVETKPSSFKKSSSQKKSRQKSGIHRKVDKNKADQKFRDLIKQFREDDIKNRRAISLSSCTTPSPTQKKKQTSLSPSNKLRNLIYNKSLKPGIYRIEHLIQAFSALSGYGHELKKLDKLDKKYDQCRLEISGEYYYFKGIPS